MDLKDAVVVVTGGTGGVGSRVCSAFFGQGCRVLAADRLGPSAEQSKQIADNPERLSYLEVDTSTIDGANTMVDAALKEYGQLDVLVNAAAVTQGVPFQDLDGLTDDLWNHILAINLTGPERCIKAVAPVMLRQQRGRIVNIGSIAGISPSGSSIAYAVSKAGILHLTRCMAVALAPHVLVNAVAPGAIAGTRISANWTADFLDKTVAGSQLRRSVAIDDVVDQIVTLARGDSTTGTTVVIDGGIVFR